MNMADIIFLVLSILGTALAAWIGVALWRNRREKSRIELMSGCMNVCNVVCASLLGFGQVWSSWAFLIGAGAVLAVSLVCWAIKSIEERKERERRMIEELKQKSDIIE